MKAEEGITREVRSAVDAACQEFGVDRVIFRSSVEADWDGLVDVMPTVVSRNNWFSLLWNLSAVRWMAENPEILNYARSEGVSYDPAKVTISMAPYLGDPTPVKPRFTYTQHPNVSGGYQVDESDLRDLNGGGYYGLHHTSEFYSPKKDIERSRYPFHEKIREKANQVLGNGILDPNTSYQVEGGIDGRERAWVFQMREFAVNKISKKDFVRATSFVGVNARPRVLTVCKGDDISVYKKFEAENPETDYALIVKTSSLPLKITDQPSQRMIAYGVANSGPALSHNNTRMVQAVLGRGGVANLMVGHRFDGARTGDKIRTDDFLAY